MKQNQLNTKPQKVRVLANGDIYYTFKHWETKEVDGVTFIGVNKYEPSQNLTQAIYYLRKDALEYVK
jgi:hypothetical protein